MLVLFYILIFWLGGMWDLSSQPGIEPTSLTLEGRVLTTGPPGKPLAHAFGWTYIYAFLSHIHLGTGCRMGMYSASIDCA